MNLQPGTGGPRVPCRRRGLKSDPEPTGPPGSPERVASPEPVASRDPEVEPVTGTVFDESCDVAGESRTGDVPGLAIAKCPPAVIATCYTALATPRATADPWSPRPQSGRSRTGSVTRFVKNRRPDWSGLQIR